MTNPGGNFRPSGFLANMRAAYTPSPMTDEEASGPLVVPKTVKVSGWLIFVVGVVFAISTGLFMSQKAELSDTIVAKNASDVAACVTQFGSTGDTITATEPADRVDFCKKISLATQEGIDQLNSSMTVNGVLYGIFALAMLVAGWYTRLGLRWARRIAATVAILIFLMVMFGAQFSLFVFYPQDLGGILVLAISVALLYAGKGARYFAVARTRGTGPAGPASPAGPSLTKR